MHARHCEKEGSSESGLLRRFDYHTKFRGVPENLNYAADHKKMGVW